MSLAIDLDEVVEVLLADGWHTVRDATFDLDAYEYVVDIAERVERFGTAEGVSCLYNGGTGFNFYTYDADRRDVWIAGPIASIIAVRTRTP